MGRSYTPMTSLEPYQARGIATWYGRRYHGKQTSSGELYDMYAMTAAHTTLPIPSYARVTNLDERQDRWWCASTTAGRSSTGASSTCRTPPRTSSACSAAAAPWSRWRPSFPAATARCRAAPAQPAAAAPHAREPSARRGARSRAAGIASGAADTGRGRSRRPLPAARRFRFAGERGEFPHAHESADGRAGRQPAVFARDGLFRVHAGPYASQPEARQAAERINQALGVRPIVLTR